MKIIFRPDNELTDVVGAAPIPAYRSVPDWYKSMPNLQEGYTKSGIMDNDSFVPNKTIKSCVPFLDALTAGYVYRLPADLEIKRKEKSISFKWRVEGDMIESHDLNVQAPGLPLAPGNEDGSLLKWNGHWVINTPPGYSLLFTHPLNRHDLPFRTFSGLVDTDIYDAAVSFPFEWIGPYTERSILEKGTPIVQIIPIKRDMWKHELEPFDDIRQRRFGFEFASRIVSSYRRQYWQRKAWK